METPKNSLEDATNLPEKEGDKVKAFPPEERSKELAQSLENLDTALTTDKGISRQTIDSLKTHIKNAAETAGIEIGGDVFLLKDLPPDLDRKKQQKICSQIIAGDYTNSGELQILPSKVAEAISRFAGKNLDLGSLQTAQGLKLPQTVGGTLSLDSLASAPSRKRRRTPFAKNTRIFTFLVRCPRELGRQPSCSRFV